MKNKSLLIWSAIVAVLFLRYGNGFYLIGDSLGYFAHLSALFVNGNYDFSDFFNACQMPAFVVTPNGLPSNIYGPGVAFFWMPFFLMGRLVIGLTGVSIKALCSYPVVYFTNAGSFIFGVLTVILAYRILKRLKLDQARPLVLISSVFGTSYFFYMTYGASMSHVVSSFTITLLFYFCLDNRKSKSPYIYWALLGVIAGLMVLVRIKNVLFLPLLMIPLRKLQKDQLKWALVLSGGFLLAFLSQFLVWHKLFGSVLALPRFSALSFDRFVLGEVLFSPFHGLLYWTPLVLVSMLGFGGAKRLKMQDEPLLLAFCFLLQIALCGFLEVWWMGFSFGVRYLVDSFLPMAVGLAIPFAVLKSKLQKRILMGVYALLSLWVVGLFVNYDLGHLNIGEIVLAPEIFDMQAKLLLSPGTLLGSVFNFPVIFWPGFISVVIVFSVGCYFYQKINSKVLLAFFMLGLAVFMGATVNSTARTRVHPLTDSDKKALILSEDWLNYNFFLYRLTEIQYLIMQGDMETAEKLNEKNIEKYYDTKIWTLWEVDNNRKMNPDQVLPILIKKSQAQLDPFLRG